MRPPGSFLAIVLGGCTVVIDRPQTPPIDNPCDLGIDAPTANIISLVRIERPVSELASVYQNWMDTIARGLMAGGIRPTASAMLRLTEAGGENVAIGSWSCFQGFGPEPSFIIQHYAKEPSLEGAPRCAVDALVDAGKDLSWLVASYPPELSPGSPTTAFGPAPDILIVLVIDSLGRKFGLSDAECASAGVLAEVSRDEAVWAQFAPRPDCFDADVCAAQHGRVAMDKVFHYAITTSEGVSRSEFVEACRTVPRPPLSRIDEMGSSPRALFGPLYERVNEAGGHARVVPLCEMLSPDLVSEHLADIVLEIVEGSGLSLSRDRLEELLAGDDSLVGGP